MPPEQAEAVSLQSEMLSALTLTLSPRRGKSQPPVWEKSLDDEHFSVLKKFLLLLGGEGRGEGERFVLLNYYGPAASEAGFNAGASPARRIRLFTPENGADVAIARCVHGSPRRLDRPVAMKINRIP